MENRQNTIPIYITHYNILTCLGNIEDTWNNLLNNKTGLKYIKLNNRDLSKYPLGIIDSLKGDLGTKERILHLIDILVEDIKSKIKHYTNYHLIVATTKAAADEIIKHKLEAQAWQITSIIAKKLNISTYTTVSAACASSTLAIIEAYYRIISGVCNKAIVIGIDILSKFVISGFAALKALSTSYAKPFDQKRTGLCLGEGYGYIVLEKETNSTSIDSTIEIIGAGSSCDAFHITAPAKDGSGLIRCIKQACSNIDINMIKGINAHGTATIYNDAMEIEAFTKLWKTPIAIYSVKGAIGHLLGACGTVETAIAIKSLLYKIIPPTVGLEEKIPTYLNISGKKAFSFTNPYILTCNSGFGGINAALLLYKRS